MSTLDGDATEGPTFSWTGDGCNFGTGVGATAFLAACAASWALRAFTCSRRAAASSISTERLASARAQASASPGEPGPATGIENDGSFGDAGVFSTFSFTFMSLRTKKAHSGRISEEKERRACKKDRA